MRCDGDGSGTTIEPLAADAAVLQSSSSDLRWKIRSSRRRPPADGGVATLLLLLIHWSRGRLDDSRALTLGSSATRSGSSATPDEARSASS